MVLRKLDPWVRVFLVKKKKRHPSIRIFFKKPNKQTNKNKRKPKTVTNSGSRFPYTHVSVNQIATPKEMQATI